MGTEVKIVQECILFIAHVDKGSVEARHQLLYLCQVNVADSIGDVSGFLLQGYQAAFLKQGDGNFRRLHVYD